MEQKHAALGTPSGNGAQKLADVLSIVSPSVIQLLQSSGIPVQQKHVPQIVNAAVAGLNSSADPEAAVLAAVNSALIVMAAIKA